VHYAIFDVHHGFFSFCRSLSSPRLFPTRNRKLSVICICFIQKSYNRLEIDYRSYAGFLRGSTFQNINISVHSSNRNILSSYRLLLLRGSRGKPDESFYRDIETHYRVTNELAVFIASTGNRMKHRRIIGLERSLRFCKAIVYSDSVPSLRIYESTIIRASGVARIQKY